MTADDMPLGVRPGSRDGGADDDSSSEEERRVPWHFKVLVYGTALYIVYRLIWLVFTLTGHGWNG